MQFSLNHLNNVSNFKEQRASGYEFYTVKLFTNSGPQANYQTIAEILRHLQKVSLCYVMKLELV